MDSTQERSPSFRCFDNLFNPENWETYRLPPDVTSFEDESLAGDDDDLTTTSEVQEEDAEKQDDGDVTPFFQNPVIDELEDVIKSLEKASFKPRKKFYKPFEISPEIIKCKFKAGSAEKVETETLEEGKCFTNTDKEKNNLITSKLKEDGMEESVKKQDEDVSNKNDNPEEEIVSSSAGQDMSENSTTVDEENMERTKGADDDRDDDGDEPFGDGIDNSLCPWLTSDPGLGFSNAAVFLGLTSGSLLTGFSIGWMVGAKEGQCWLSSAVSSVVARRVWDSVGMVIITGMVGTYFLGLSSYNFWFRKEKK